VQEIRELLPATFLKTGIPAQQRFQIRQGNEYSNTKDDFFLLNGLSHEIDFDNVDKN
jgi:hypothetical protein